MAHASTSAFDRFNDALRNLDDQIQELRERLDDRRKSFRAELRKQTSRIEQTLRKSALYRRAEQAGKDLQTQVESSRDSIYDVFGIASKAEIEKLNRKLAHISKRLNDIAKDQAAEL
jgi:protein subunit release factor A